MTSRVPEWYAALRETDLRTLDVPRDVVEGDCGSSCGARRPGVDPEGEGR